MAVPEELRPEVVRALSRPRHLTAELVDQVLDASDAEREAAAAQLLDDTRSFLEHAGVLKPTQSVLDLHRGQVQALAAVYGIVDAWWGQPGYAERPLGGILKVVPAEVAAQAAMLLRWARLLAAEEGSR